MSFMLCAYKSFVFYWEICLIKTSFLITFLLSQVLNISSKWFECLHYPLEKKVFYNISQKIFLKILCNGVSEVRYYLIKMCHLNEKYCISRFFYMKPVLIWALNSSALIIINLQSNDTTCLLTKQNNCQKHFWLFINENDNQKRKKGKNIDIFIY